MKPRLTIQTKLIGGFAALLLVAILLGATSLWNLRSLRETMTRTVRDTSQRLQLAAQIGAAESEMMSTQGSYLVFVYAKDKSFQQERKADYQRATEGLEQSIAAMAPLARSVEDRAALSELRSGADRWRNDFAEIVNLSESGQADGAAEISRTRSISMHTALSKVTEGLRSRATAELAADEALVAGQTQSAEWLVMAMFGLSLPLGFAVWYTVRQIAGELQQATVRLSDGGDQIAGAAAEMSSASQALASGASEQAASLEETSASAEQLTSMTRRNANDSRTAAEVMTSVDQRVHTGNEALRLMAAAIEEISTSSDKVSRIIKVIDEIAFQTNILALNAAVEAARAGEAGMGFAVVADEVRSLAQRSAQAAKDTSALIAESISRAGEGKARLAQMTEVMGSITESATQVKGLVDQVHLGSQEQSRGIDEIARAITQMDKVTQSTAASAEQTASSSQQLARQSSNLRAIVTQLSAMTGTGHAHPAVAASPMKPAKSAARPLPSKPLAAALPKKLQRLTAAPALAGKPSPEEVFPLEDFQAF